MQNTHETQHTNHHNRTPYKTQNTHKILHQQNNNQPRKIQINYHNLNNFGYFSLITNFALIGDNTCSNKSSNSLQGVHSRGLYSKQYYIKSTIWGGEGTQS